MRLHLVDGTYELFRAHYGKRPPRTDPDGRDVKATRGIVSSMLALLEDPTEAVTHIAVAFDNPIESWRNVTFPAYKSSAGLDPDLLAQFDLAEEAVAALGVVVWSMDEVEADDALGAAALRWADDVDQVRILTPDKDLGQVVRGERIVQVDRMREKLYDEAGVTAKLGVPPTSVPDYLALVGDTADGIPGIPGFGAKGAAAVLTRYPHIEDIPELGVSWDVTVRGADRLAATLAERRDDALLYRHLATLTTDVVLPQSRVEELAWDGVPRAVFAPVCDRIDGGSLLERPLRWR